MLREKRGGGTGGVKEEPSTTSVAKTNESGSLPPHPLEGYGFPQIGVEQSVDAFDACVIAWQPVVVLFCKA